MFTLQCHKLSRIVSFRSLNFTPWVISPEYPLTPLIASNTYRFSAAPTSERNDLPHPPLTQTEIWCVRSLGKEPMLLLLSSERKHTCGAFEADREPCCAQREREREVCTEKGQKRQNPFNYITGKKHHRNKLHQQIIRKKMVLKFS